MIFWTPILEYLKILSLPNSILSLSQPVTARKNQAECFEPQLVVFGSFVFDHCLAMHYLVSTLVLQSFR